MNNYISISIKKNQVVIKVDENAEQREIVSDLKKKIIELKNLYKDDKTPILITGKVLKNKEMDEIQNIIKRFINVQIEFDSPKALGLHSIKKTFYKEVATSETKFHKGSIRSGQRLEFEGSLVIIGDVNAGAEVIAGENIVILGILRGLAHAGAKGNKDAVIEAQEIEALQVRIADIVKEIDKEDEGQIHKVKTSAYINDKDELIVE
jgi:septum site-determining protein MinC